MDHLHKRLSNDYTLFNLNDAETTKFYVNNLDYLIANFPYFKDISTLTQYFVSDNGKFNSKFQTRITKFLDIIKYDHTKCSGHADAQSKASGSYEAARETERDIVAELGKCHVADKESVSALFPRSDSTPQEGGERHAMQPERSFPSIESRRPASLITVRSDPMFPNHFPKGPEFVVNITRVVMQSYVRILNFHMGRFVVTSRFIKQIVDKLEYEVVSSLLSNLIKSGKALSVIVGSDCVQDIAKKNLCALELLIESALQADANSNEDEERLLDQIYENKEELIRGFFDDAACHGYFPGQDSSGDGNPLVFPSAYSVLLSLCINRSSVDIREVEIGTLNRFTLQYVRLLSYNRAVSESMLLRLIELFFAATASSHLLLSVSRIILKSAPSLLDSLGFFERLRDRCYISVSKARGSDMIPDGLFAYLIKIYVKFAAFMKEHHPSWRDLYLIMDHSVRLEKYRYRNEELRYTEEYEGFERYILDCLLSDMPYSSAFEDAPLR